MYLNDERVKRFDEMVKKSHKAIFWELFVKWNAPIYPFWFGGTFHCEDSNQH
jgi:hypothetical protein